METLKIKGEDGFYFEFHSPQHKEESLTSYSISIFSKSMNATISVENSIYGESPLEFFQRIENDWRGWNGEKEWSAIEGEYSFTAKSDSTGHIELEVSLQSNYYPPLWKSSIEMILEAGQIEGIVKGLKAFFA